MFEASNSNSKEEGIILCKAANIIRKYIFRKEEFFDGDVSTVRQKKSVPPHLLHLIDLILEGAKQCEDISTSTSAIALKLAELIQFNAVKQRRRSSASIRRYSKSNEPPLPVSLGLMIHAKTRKKSIIDHFHSNGLCVSYSRILEIQDTITKQLCEKYNREGIVCPPTLQPKLFTVAAIDNIDHNTSSTTSKASFHGTSISIFQYHNTLILSLYLSHMIHLSL